MATLSSHDRGTPSAAPAPPPRTSRRLKFSQSEIQSQLEQLFLFSSIASSTATATAAATPAADLEPLAPILSVLSSPPPLDWQLALLTSCKPQQGQHLPLEAAGCLPRSTPRLCRTKGTRDPTRLRRKLPRLCRVRIRPLKSPTGDRIPQTPRRRTQRRRTKDRSRPRRKEKGTTRRAQSRSKH